MPDPVPVGISSCLIGEPVRFDGGHKQNRYIMDTLGQYFEFRSFCPEMAIGLGAPRPTLRLVKRHGRIAVRGVKDESIDVTHALVEIAEAQTNWHEQICGYIVKKGSPSCGMERVKVYHKDIPQADGTGLYTRTMMENYPNLPVEEEGRLGDPILRENFVQRVFIYQRWKQLMAKGISLSALMSFHAQHKLILFSRNQDRARALGKRLSQIQDNSLSDFVDKYVAELMSILRIPARRSNHVNVLEHIRGYLKQDLDKSDKQELTESIENYRLGLLPLIVPVTLLRHHFRRNPDDYIEQSYYMRPHPDELMLLNQL